MTALRKVLVVDDDAVIGRSFTRVLSGKGYAVITAANGEEALSKMENEKYDAVFTDIKMPGMSGIEVAEHIKAHQPWMPVVIVTGYGTEENVKRANEVGVTEILQKPLSPETIEKSVAAQFVKEAPKVEKKIAETKLRSPLTNVLLFFAAPFIGLAYAIAFPFVGLGVLAWMGGKALLNK